MSTIKIKQVKSRIGAPADQKRTLGSTYEVPVHREFSSDQQEHQFYF